MGSLNLPDLANWDAKVSCSGSCLINRPTFSTIQQSWITTMQWNFPIIGNLLPNKPQGMLSKETKGNLWAMIQYFGNATQSVSNKPNSNHHWPSATLMERESSKNKHRRFYSYNDFFKLKKKQRVILIGIQTSLPYHPDLMACWIRRILSGAYPEKT